MRNPKNVFHLAIPSHDLDATYEFYVNGLGCKLARRYGDRITLDFFGDQVVCHLNPDKIDEKPEMYPRHFGITFYDRKEFDDLIEMARSRNLPFYKEPFDRFKGNPEAHSTFFLVDPSNNLLEFKYYQNSEMMY